MVFVPLGAGAGVHVRRESMSCTAREATSTSFNRLPLRWAEASAEPEDWYKIRRESPVHVGEPASSVDKGRGGPCGAPSRPTGHTVRRPSMIAAICVPSGDHTGP